ISRGNRHVEPRLSTDSAGAEFYSGGRPPAAKLAHRARRTRPACAGGIRYGGFRLRSGKASLSKIADIAGGLVSAVAAIAGSPRPGVATGARRLYRAGGEIISGNGHLYAAGGRERAARPASGKPAKRRASAGATLFTRCFGIVEFLQYRGAAGEPAGPKW